MRLGENVLEVILWKLEAFFATSHKIKSSKPLNSITFCEISIKNMLKSRKFISKKSERKKRKKKENGVQTIEKKKFTYSCVSNILQLFYVNLWVYSNQFAG